MLWLNTNLFQIMLLDVFISEKRIYLVTELASKGTLKNYLKEKKSSRTERGNSETELCKYFYEIVKGVAALHKRDIAHR